MQLNQGQQEAADAFFKFLLDPTQKEFIISGPAGTGKTYWMGHIIDTVLPQYSNTCKLIGIDPIYTTVALTATTNKASDVLSTATGRPTETIHTFMNLRVSEDYSSGRTNLAKTKKWVVHQNTILFVDEAFTADSNLLRYIREGTHNSKIVWVGDHCQLDPVMEPVSPLLNKGIPFYELTEQMRTNQSALHTLNQQLRNTIETGVFKPIHTVDDVIQWITDDSVMEQVIQDEFISIDNQARVLAYTNARVMDFNDHIRTLRGISDNYVVGEHLICNSAIVNSRMYLGTEEEVTITHLSDKTTLEPITDDIELEVIHATLETNYSGTLQHVPLPVDRDYLTQLIKYFARQKDWINYFKLKNTYPDLRPRDAVTVHKAQGSTFDTVIIDCENLSTCRNPTQAARMLYVAASRARHKVIFYGKLASKYGGITDEQRG